MEKMENLTKEIEIIKKGPGGSYRYEKYNYWNKKLAGWSQ